jgi:hypothetical protein
LNLFGFQRSNIILTGFTLENNLPNDGGTLYFPGNEDKLDNQNAYTSTNILVNLVKMGIHFNLVLIDGNHDGNYLKREIELIDQLLCKNGILAIDDVNQEWKEVNFVFQDILKGKNYNLIGTNNRIGIIQKII